MKKFIALVLTLALAVSLCACSSKAGNQTVTFTVPMDDSTYTFTAPVDENGESATLPGGADRRPGGRAGQPGTESGADALLWQGIQTFAGTYGYTADDPHCRRHTLAGRGRGRPARSRRERRGARRLPRRHHGRGALPRAGKLP